MEDQAIINLYFARSETAIAETAAKYGRYCYHIAYNILTSREDSEESVNDTYLAAWGAMPPRRPGVLATFLGRLTRNISLDRWKNRTAQKRGGGQVPMALEELEECIPGGCDPVREAERMELNKALTRFLDTLPQSERQVFVCRYWYLDPVPGIASRYGFTQAKVTSMLHRTRSKLRRFLEKEGLV